VNDALRFIDVRQGFQWDEGNLYKNWKSHRVSVEEAEQVFHNEPIDFFEDLNHSSVEPRYGVYGKTDEGRCLFIVFTIRAKLVRVISARDQNREESKVYEQKRK
jgi:uncharacterized protein